MDSKTAWKYLRDRRLPSEMQQKHTWRTRAAIDRLVHHCVILELNIPSYRVEQAKKAKQEAAAE